MPLSPLKFSLGVSVLVHGLVVGGVAWLGQQRQTAPVIADTKTTTLELIAAPTSTLERLVKTVVAPIPPAPNPTLRPPEEIGPVKIVELPPVKDALLPQLTTSVETVTTPVSVTTAVVPTAPVSVAITPSAISGDNSSPLPGVDVTTAVGSSAAKAKPDYLKNPEPEYPLQARRRRQEGLVLLNVTVSGSGRATEISLKQSSGYELLDQAALKAVQDWHFEPARIGTVGVESRIEVPVRFKLTR